MIFDDRINLLKKERIKQQIGFLNDKIERIQQITGKKHGQLIIYGRNFEDEVCFYLKRKGYEVTKRKYYIEIWV